MVPRSGPCASPMMTWSAHRQHISPAWLISHHLHSQPDVKLLIGGDFVSSKTDKWQDVVNPVRRRGPAMPENRHGTLPPGVQTDWHLPLPIAHPRPPCALLLPLLSSPQATQEVVSRVPETTPAEFQAAVDAAAAAFPAWRSTAVPTRARVFLKLQQLIRESMEELAASVTREQGKTLADARGDVFRGLEVVEYAAGIGPDLMGEMLENVSTGIDTYSIRQPLGVRDVKRARVRVPGATRCAPRSWRGGISCIQCAGGRRP